MPPTLELVQQYLDEAVQDRTRFMQICETVIGSAKRAGVTEQQILDKLHDWYSKK